MKLIPTIVLLLISFTAVTAQLFPRNAFKASVGVSRHIQQKVNAPTVMLAFNKDFLPNTLVEISTAWILPVNVNTEEEIRELQSYRFGMNLLFKVLEDRKQSFNAGLGFSAGLYNTDWTIIRTEETGSSAEFIPGFSAIAEYDFILPSYFFFGGRASISRFDVDRNAWFLGAVVGLKF